MSRKTVTFWNELRQITKVDLKECEFTQEEYAQKIGCTQQAFSRWINTPNAALNTVHADALIKRLRKHGVMVKSISP